MIAPNVFETEADFERFEQKLEECHFKNQLRKQLKNKFPQSQHQAQEILDAFQRNNQALAPNQRVNSHNNIIYQHPEMQISQNQPRNFPQTCEHEEYKPVSSQGKVTKSQLQELLRESDEVKTQVESLERALRNLAESRDPQLQTFQKGGKSKQTSQLTEEEIDPDHLVLKHGLVEQLNNQNQQIVHCTHETCGKNHEHKQEFPDIDGDFGSKDFKKMKFSFDPCFPEFLENERKNRHNVPNAQKKKNKNKKRKK